MSGDCTLGFRSAESGIRSPLQQKGLHFPRIELSFRENILVKSTAIYVTEPQTHIHSHTRLPSDLSAHYTHLEQNLVKHYKDGTDKIILTHTHTYPQTHTTTHIFCMCRAHQVTTKQRNAVFLFNSQNCWNQHTLAWEIAMKRERGTC